MSLKQRVAWVVVAVLAALAFGVVAPMWAEAGPDTSTVTEPTTVQLLVGEVTVPAGWELDIAAASQNVVVASKRGVRVSTSDVIWLGSTQSLLDRVAQRAYPDGAIVPVVPDEEGDDLDTAEPAASDRAVWVLTSDPAGTDGAARVVVVTQRESAVVLVIRGSAGDVAALDAELAAIIESVELEDPELDVEAAA